MWLAAGVVAIIAVAVLAIVVGGPPNHTPGLSTALQRAVISAGDEGTIDMTEAAPFEWDRMYAFGSYSSGDYIRESLRFDWPFGDDLVDSGGGRGLVVFVVQQSVTGWSIINEDDLDARVDFRSALGADPVQVERAKSDFRVERLIEDTVGGKPIFLLTPVS